MSPVLEHDRSLDLLALVIGAGLIIAIVLPPRISPSMPFASNRSRDDSACCGAAVAVVGWWSGYKIGGMIALFMAAIWKPAAW